MVHMHCYFSRFSRILCSLSLSSFVRIVVSKYSFSVILRECVELRECLTGRKEVWMGIEELHSVQKEEHREC